MNKRNDEENECLVVQCANCGRIHVYFRKWRDGESCSQCGGGPFRMLGVPTVRGNKEKLVKIRVSVEREELDRLMKDLDNVNKLANETYNKVREMSKIKIEC